jgi:predicted permease
MNDLKFAIRQLRKNPGFAAVAVLTLALGIGANTAIFSVVDAVLLRPLPFPEPEQLVMVWNQLPGQGLRQLPLSVPEFLDYQREQQAFAGLAVFRTTDGSLAGRGDPVHVSVAMVSEQYFATLGIRPLQGRNFTPEEHEPGQGPVMILDSGFWQRQFAGQRDVVGQDTVFNGTTHKIVGVVRDGMAFMPAKVDVWIPMVMGSEGFSRENHALAAVARLRPGVSLARGSQEINRLAQLQKQAHPNSYPDDQWGAYVQPLRSAYVGDTRPALLALLAAVGFVLLIACANVANLMAARSAARRKELVIRSALGGHRLRILRQLLTESLLLAALGGGAGLILACWGIPVLIRLAENQIPEGLPIGVNLRALGFTFVLTLLTGVLFGVMPALRGSKVDLREALAEGGRDVASAPGSGLRSALVISEMALAMVLLIGAGLLLRSFTKLLRVDTGYQPENTLTFQMDLPETRYPEAHHRRTFWREMMTRIEAAPGVEVVGATSKLPLTAGGDSGSVFVEDLPASDPGSPAPCGYFEADKCFVTPGYFRSLGVQLVSGRFLEERDGVGTPAVVVDESFARRAWPEGRDPIGRHLAIGLGPNGPAWLRVVGVIRHIKSVGLAKQGREQVYFPCDLEPPASLFFTVKISATPGAVLGLVRRAVATLDASLPIHNVLTMDQRLGASVGLERLQTTLVGAFSLLALILAAVGLYGVLSYSVSLRTRELGIRMALGAPAQGVVGLIFWQGMRMVLMGGVIGLGAALALTRFLRSLLYEVEATDPLTFAGVILVLALAALLASYLPARRAAKVDPMVALRTE